jgi:hypothetical protein
VSHSPMVVPIGRHRVQPRLKLAAE